MDTNDRVTTRRILLTGAAGAVGRCVGPALLDRGHDVRGFDLAECDGLSDHVVGDITDADALDRAMAGRDTLLHLAAYPNPAPFVDVLVGPNVVGLYRVMDAARNHGVGRAVLASSVHAISGVPKDAGQTVTARDRAPVNDYGLTKVWAEELGAMFARTPPPDTPPDAPRNQPMSVLAVRLGWFLRSVEDARRMVARGGSNPYFISHRDAQRFFVAAVEADLSDHPGRFAVAYAVGPPGPDDTFRFDPDPARSLLGFVPQDKFPAGLSDELLAALDNPEGCPS